MRLRIVEEQEKLPDIDGPGIFPRMASQVEDVYNVFLKEIQR